MTTQALSLRMQTPPLQKRQLSSAERSVVAANFKGLTPSDDTIKKFIIGRFSVLLSTQAIHNARCRWELEVIPYLGAHPRDLSSRMEYALKKNLEGTVRAISHVMKQNSKFCSHPKVLYALDTSRRLERYVQKDAFPFEMMKRTFESVIRQGSYPNLIREIAKKRSDLMGCHIGSCLPAEALINRKYSEGLTALLDAGLRPNIQVFRKMPLLTYAAHMDYIGSVKVLAGSPLADINIRGGRLSNSPLMFALRNKNIEMMDHLLAQKGIDVNLSNKSLETPLIRCVRTGFLPGQQALMERKELDVNQKGRLGQTALAVAVICRKMSAFNVLLRDSRILLEIRDAQGNTPLMLAAKDPKAYRYLYKLVKLKASADFKQEGGAYAIHIAAENNNLRGVQLLAKYTTNGINLKDQQLRTSLMIALRKGYKDIASFLLNRRGATFAGEDAYQSNLMHHAVCSRSSEFLDPIYAREPSLLNAKNHNGETPIYLAVANGDEASVQKLLSFPTIDLAVEMSIESLAKAIDCFTKAVELGKPSIIKALLDSGKIPLNEGCGSALPPPLVTVTQYGNERFVKYLLDNESVEVGVRDSSGDAIWEIAIKQEQYGALRVILDHERVDINQAYDGLTPLFADVLNVSKCDELLEREILQHPGIRWEVHDKAYWESIIPLRLHEKLDEILWLNKRIGRHSTKKLISKIEKKGKFFALGALFLKKPEAMHKVISMNKGELLARSVSYVNLSHVVTKDPSDAFPTPHIEVDLNRLLNRPKSLEVKCLNLSVMVSNVKNRSPLIGLPNAIEQKEEFDKAYNQIEKNLQLILIALEELRAKHKNAEGDDKTNWAHHLGLIYAELDEIAPNCGPRYLQSLESLLFNDIYQIEGLDCVTVWRDEKRTQAIVKGDDDVTDCRLDLGKVMHTDKMQALDTVFLKTKTNNDAHTKTGFLEKVRAVAGLPEGVVYSDPFTSTYPVDMPTLRKEIALQMPPEVVIAKAVERVQPTGGDQNPYLGTLSAYATRHSIDPVELMVDAFDMESSSSSSSGINDQYAVLLLRELRVLC